MRDREIINSALLPAKPLWSRVPTQSKDGKVLSDFMMLIPGFARWPEVRKAETLQLLQQLLSRFEETVVFAELNLKLNLLWVSLRPGKESSLELAAAVREQIPEVVLVANQTEALSNEPAKNHRRFDLRRLSRD